MEPRSCANLPLPDTILDRHRVWDVEQQLGGGNALPFDPAAQSIELGLALRPERLHDLSGVAGNATLLTTIVTVEPVYVYADFDENSLLRYNELVRAQKLPGGESGKVPVQLQLGNEEGFPHRGYIESFDNRLDAGTGSILLRAVFPNQDGAIVPGLFARIRIPLSERYNAVMIRESAIGTDQALKFVLTLSSSNTVEYRQVTLGPSIDGMRVVRSGLTPGEEIVVNGLARVGPGMPVTPEKATATNDTKNEKGLAQR